MAGQERVHPAVPGLIAAGFLCVLGAEALPWVRVKSNGQSQNSEVSQALGRDELYVSDIGLWQAPAYSLSWAVLLAIVLAASMVGPAWRRGSGAAALGWAGGHLAMLVGVASTALRGGGALIQLREAGQFAPAIGLYAAFGGVALLGAAAAVLLRSRTRQGVEDPAGPDREPGTEALELTVTPLPPPSWGREEPS